MALQSKDHKKIFIVSDDLGLDPSVNQGIFATHRKNPLLSGASIMPVGLAFDDAISGLKQNPDLKVGIHLVLVEEKSLLTSVEIPSLLSDGFFHKNHRIFFIRYIFGLIKKDEIKRELEAQVQKCFDTGLTPGFLNSHQHLHLLPGIMDIFIYLAKKYNISYIRLVKEPVTHSGSLFRRVQLAFLRILSRMAKRKLIANGLAYNDFFVGFINAGNMSVKDIELATKLQDKNPDSVIELGCHVGFENDELVNKYKHWGYNWQKEANVLVEYPLSLE